MYDPIRLPRQRMRRQPQRGSQRTPSRSDTPLGSLDNALDAVGLFDTLGPSVRTRLLASSQPRRFPRGDLIYVEGEASDSLLLLMSGAVILFRSSPQNRHATLAAVRPPGMLGVEALAGGMPRMTSARAVHESFGLALSEAELAKVMHQHLAAGDAARRCLVAELSALAEQRADDILLDLPARVAKTLMKLTVGGGVPRSIVEANQQLVATLARGSRQSVNQALKQFVARGWLRLEKGRIVVLDPAALERRARATTR